MQLIQLSVKSALVGLLAAGGDILSKFSVPAVSEDSVDESTRQSDDGLQFLVRIIVEMLGRLQAALSDLGTIATERLAAVKAEHLIMILGEGILAFDEIATLLSSPISEKLEHITSLGYFHLSLTHLVDILRRYLDCTHTGANRC
jgi:hypothetical protein